MINGSETIILSYGIIVLALNRLNRVSSFGHNQPETISYLLVPYTVSALHVESAVGNNEHYGEYVLSRVSAYSCKCRGRMSFIGISPSKNATFNFDGRSAVINPSSSTSGLHYGRSVEVSAIPGMSSTTGLAQQTNLSQSYTVHGAHQSSTYNSPAHHFPASDLVCSAKLSYILFSDNYMFCLGKSPRAGEWHYERPTRFTIYPLPEGYLCPARLRGRDTPSRAFNRGIRPRSCSGLCDAQRKLHARTTTRCKR